MTHIRQTYLWKAIKLSLLMTVGVAIAIYIVNETINAIQVMRGGATTIAHVISADDEDREYDDGRRVAIVTVAVYEFAVDGHPFYGRTEVSQGSLSIGDILTIVYNPKDPSKNRVKGTREVLGHLFTVFLFGGMLSYFLIKTAIDRFLSLKAAKSSLDR
jgi:hypothetical protein